MIFISEEKLHTTGQLMSPVHVQSEVEFSALGGFPWTLRECGQVRSFKPDWKLLFDHSDFKLLLSACLSPALSAASFFVSAELLQRHGAWQLARDDTHAYAAHRVRPLPGDHRARALEA